MKRSKNIASSIVLVCMLAIPILSVADVTSIPYFTGRVSFFDREKIVVDGRTYLVIERCVYLKHTRRNNAYFEDKASPHDVRGGNSVILHINGNVVDKIIIEEWKQ